MDVGEWVGNLAFMSEQEYVQRCNLTVDVRPALAAVSSQGCWAEVLQHHSSASQTRLVQELFWVGRGQEELGRMWEGR